MVCFSTESFPNHELPPLPTIIFYDNKVYFSFMLHAHCRYMFCFCSFEIQFTCYKTYLFQLYNSVVFSIFTRLCNYHHYPILEHFHHSKNNPIPISSHSPLPLFSQSLATINLLSVYIDLPILDISYK